MSVYSTLVDSRTLQTHFVGRASFAQVAPNGGLLAVDFNEEVAKANVIHTTADRTRIQTTCEGIYTCTYKIRWAANAAGVRISFLSINGASASNDKQHGRVGMDATAGIMEWTGCGTMRLGQGDYVELQLFQNSGGNVTVGTDAPAQGGHVELALVRVG
jgi:hypothetical protein